MLGGDEESSVTVGVCKLSGAERSRIWECGVQVLAHQLSLETPLQYMVSDVVLVLTTGEDPQEATGVPGWTSRGLN